MVSTGDRTGTHPHACLHRAFLLGLFVGCGSGSSALAPVDAAGESPSAFVDTNATDLAAPDLEPQPDVDVDVPGDVAAGAPDVPAVSQDAGSPPGISCRFGTPLFQAGPYPEYLLQVAEHGGEIAATATVTRAPSTDFSDFEAGGYNTFDAKVEDWTFLNMQGAGSRLALRIPIPTVLPPLGARRHFVVNLLGGGEGVQRATGLLELDPDVFPHLLPDFAAMKNFVFERERYDAVTMLDAILDGTVVRQVGPPEARTLMVRIERSLCGPIAGEVLVWFDNPGRCVLGCGPPPPVGTRGLFRLIWQSNAGGRYLQPFGNPSSLDQWDATGLRLHATPPTLILEGTRADGGIRDLTPDGAVPPS